MERVSSVFFVTPVYPEFVVPASPSPVSSLSARDVLLLLFVVLVTFAPIFVVRMVNP